MRALLTVSLLIAAACQSTSKTPATPPPIETESVKPGINDSFLSEDLDVGNFIQRFEGESREIAVYREKLADLTNIDPGMEVADVGAGTGLFLDLFAERVGQSGKVYAVDIAPEFIEHMSARIRDEELVNVVPIHCTDRSAELPDNSVDRIFICDVYHHFEYPRSTLWSLRNALRPGGEMVVIDFERIPGVSREWLLGHVRAGKEVFLQEIVDAGFELIEEVDVPELEENYFLRFR